MDGFDWYRLVSCCSFTRAICLSRPPQVPSHPRCHKGLFFGRPETKRTPWRPHLGVSTGHPLPVFLPESWDKGQVFEVQNQRQWRSLFKGPMLMLKDLWAVRLSGDSLGAGPRRDGPKGHAHPTHAASCLRWEELPRCVPCGANCPFWA